MRRERGNLDLCDDFTDLPFPEGRVVAGFDVGRSHDRSELAVFEEIGGRFICRMLRGYDRVPFAEQEADLLRMLNTLPIARLSIDKSGIGMNLAENLSRAFPQVVGEAFTNASKERWCTDFKILLQRRDLDLPLDHELVAQVHSINRRFTPSGNVSFDAERTGRGHADKFWAIVLACQKERAEPAGRVGGGRAGDRMIADSPRPGSLNGRSLPCTLRPRRATLSTQAADGASVRTRATGMRFALHDLHPNQFEDLVVEACHELLGAGVQKFATGPDGGRDGKFVGTAQEFPSRAGPLVGTTIIQAKHTIDAVGKFSDADFSGPSSSSTLSEEIPRIKALRDANQIDHYLLFANRRLGAIANEQIVARLVKETGVPSVHLFGVEQVERYVKRYDHLGTTLCEFEYDLPLRASPDDLAEVITAIADVQAEMDWPTGISATSLERVAFKKKNQINGLSEEYARHITRNYLKHFGVVEKFLADPLNASAFKSYSDAVDEFASKLVAHRGDFGSYDKLLDYMVSLLIERDGDLRSHKRLTRTVFYFMYWACDIGEIEEAHATAE